MKISAISSAQNYAHLNSFKKSKQQKEASYTYDFIDSKKLALTTSLLALATITTTNLHIMKKNNTTPMKEATKLARNIKKAVQEFNDPPIEKILKGKRDAEATRKYNQYMAQNKLDSLNQRLLNGEFSNKPQRVFNALRENEMKLMRKAGNVVTTVHK